MLNFRTAEKTATVALGATATVDLVMQPSTEERVVVSGESPLIDGTSTTTGTSYSSNVIGHLPVARNYADIALANPGADTDRGETQGRALALTVYGATSAENQWTIDGVNTTNVFKGTQGKVIHNEFVEAVEVKTGGYQAEYGRALGGIISAVTKSGGNAFHGDGFAYYDSVNTAARKQFKAGRLRHRRDAGRRRGPFRVRRLDLGGFLVKDRLWFFGAYDRASVRGHVSRWSRATYVSKDDPLPVRRDGQLLLGEAHLECGTLDVFDRNRVRRSDDQLRGGRGRPPAGPRRHQCHADREPRPRRPGTRRGTRAAPTMACDWNQLFGSQAIMARSRAPSTATATA